MINILSLPRSKGRVSGWFGCWLVVWLVGCLVGCLVAWLFALVCFGLVGYFLLALVVMWFSAADGTDMGKADMKGMDMEKWI